MKYFIQTYGCQMNISDSERVASVLERLGYEKSDTLEEADFLVLNTCSVRQKAEDRVTGLRPHMERYLENNPGMKFAITGCMVRITSTRESKKKDQLLYRMPEVDMAFRIEDVAQLPKLIKEISPELEFDDTLDDGTLENYFKIAPKKDTNYSVFVPIMTGCDKFCTYCIVPFTRGREYSRDFDSIIEECAKHVEEGALEITLVGQTVNTYGLSFNDRKSGKFENYEMNPFATLLREVDKLKSKGLKRLRFTSPHPRDFHDDVISAMAECETVSPYFHMPVQSGDNRTLRRMNRNYTMEEYMRILNKIREAIPDVSISTDIIVGFCGETEEEFQRTLDMYKELEWDWCYMARYSPRKGTYSEKKIPDDVTPKEKASRWHRLNVVMLACAEKKAAAMMGKTVNVLVNTQIGETCSGRTDGFKEVKFRSGRKLVGQIVPVKVTEVQSIEIFGELA
jgi:tRNA-2-methylthio-N6-dimethylallyladenosine synthase